MKGLPGIVAVAPSAAGGGYSTPQDLMRFVAALRAGRIPGGPPSGLGIAGGAGGLDATVEADLQGGYDLIGLANLDPPPQRSASRGWCANGSAPKTTSTLGPIGGRQFLSVRHRGAARTWPRWPARPRPESPARRA